MQLTILVVVGGCCFGGLQSGSSHQVLGQFDNPLSLQVFHLNNVAQITAPNFLCGLCFVAQCIDWSENGILAFTLLYQYAALLVSWLSSPAVIQQHCPAKNAPPPDRI